MTTIYLIRHGEAGNLAIDGRDASRNLTAKGRDDIATQAQFLKTSAGRVDHIQHSPFVRAVQTAEILQKYLRAPLIENKNLRPSGSIAMLGANLLNRQQTVILVSHLPLIQDIARAISGEMIRFYPGTLVKVERSDIYQAKGQLQWIHHP